GEAAPEVISPAEKSRAVRLYGSNAVPPPGAEATVRFPGPAVADPEAVCSLPGSASLRRGGRARNRGGSPPGGHRSLLIRCPFPGAGYAGAALFPGPRANIFPARAARRTGTVPPRRRAPGRRAGAPHTTRPPPGR